MAMTGVAAFDRTVHKTNEWLHDLMELHHGLDREKAYLALRVTLHALRDRLPSEEVVQLGAQLPTLLRGVYYEGWRPVDTPVRKRHREELLAELEQALEGYRLGRPEDIARGVFEVLTHRISKGEVRDVLQSLPGEIRELFSGGRMG